MLKYAPPAQLNPTTVTLPTGYFARTFAVDEDVILVSPSSARTSEMNISGGRHIRWIGGQTKYKGTAGSPIGIRGVSGSVFVEGLDLDLTGSHGDALNLCGSKDGSLRPDIYIQNCRIVGVSGADGTNHADIYQPQGDIGGLYVDRLTGVSNYQGFFIPPQNAVGRAELNHVNLAYTAALDPAHIWTYLLWLLDTCSAQVPYPVELNEVYIDPRHGQTLAQYGCWPAAGSVNGSGVPIGALDAPLTGCCYWPEPMLVTGAVISGAPDADFVPKGTVGLNYTSPGYAASVTRTVPRF